ncbi:sulfite exporter TauE/SafE family protein [Winogradskyella maritima]|uniref:Probable membrane transporter protein n=1 Tax=Winogradskyella maritima TaxID=1517766 RepID=A0ABV8AJY2_9FLAO|nr:sulfite exporter TauE/SafE family protein [Winogradskyella maritima]
MELLEILGYIGALIAGIVMGLIGGGGSILSVPILVYLMGINPITATAYSLFMVGASSAVGAIKNFFKGQVDLKTTFIFAIPALTSVFLTRRYLVPLLPDVMFTIGDFEVTNNIFIMLFFAVIMIASSISMIKKEKPIVEKESQDSPTYNFPVIAMQGLAVGIITGFVGAGGGFLNIPVLVLVIGLSMKKAIGTSLAIIAIKSLIGFLGDITNIDIEWPFLLIFTGISIIGIFIGVYLSKFISGKKLKKGFGYFILVMATYIIYKELF